MGVERKVCFVITPIGSEGSDPRLRSDQVFSHIIDPVVSELGYEPLRASDIPHPGIITHQIINHLLDADLVVADLTDGNPNVFYELGIRHMTRKPVVSIVEQGQRIPFDVNQSRTIQLNHRDLDSAANCKEQLDLQIRSLQANPENFFNPVSVTVDLEALHQSNDPDAQGLAQVFSVIEAMSLEISKLRDEFRATTVTRSTVPYNPSRTYEFDLGERFQLSDDDREVLKHVARGLTNPQIAEMLGISVGMAKQRVHKAMDALGVRDRTQAAVRFIEAGYLADSQ